MVRQVIIPENLPRNNSSESMRNQAQAPSATAAPNRPLPVLEVHQGKAWGSKHAAGNPGKYVAGTDASPACRFTVPVSDR